jgi:hypothetical protein
MNPIQRIEPWQQRLDEPDFCYRMFLAWLRVAPAARTAPSDPGLATQYDWAGRAIAHDNSQAIPSTPAERVQLMLSLGTETCCIELQKLLTRSKDSIDPVLTPKELISLSEAIVGLPARAAGLPTEQHLHLPPDATIDQINDLIKNLRGIGQ